MNTQEMASALVAEYEFILGVAMKYAQNNEKAQEVAQMVCEKALLSPFREGDLRNWLYGVTRNTYLNLMKYENRRAHNDMDFITEDQLEATFNLGSPSAEEVALGSSMSVRLSEALDEMNPNFREAFELYAQGYSTREIAEELGIPEGTVLSRIKRAKEQLRKRLS